MERTMYDLYSKMAHRLTLHGPFDESHRSVKYSLYGPLPEKAYPDAYPSAYPEDESAGLFIRTHPDQDHTSFMRGAEPARAGTSAVNHLGTPKTWGKTEVLGSFPFAEP
ncbi:MAG: hypothetical protein ABSB35_42880, partial [Bryobacteraceae bacterium]